MFLNSLDRKPIVKSFNGMLVRDLTESMFDFTSANFVNFSAYKVPRGFEMRSDLISQAAYNNTIYSEIVLKFNGISNPFTIDAGDVILIPSLDSAKDVIKTRADNKESSDAKKIRDSYRYIDPTRVPKRDKSLSDFEKRDLENGALPPNINEPNEKGITYRNGRVYFGEDVGQSACLKNGMTSGEFLTNVVKTRKI